VPSLDDVPRGAGDTGAQHPDVGVLEGTVPRGSVPLPGDQLDGECFRVVLDAFRGRGMTPPPGMVIESPVPGRVPVSLRAGE